MIVNERERDPQGDTLSRIRTFLGRSGARGGKEVRERRRGQSDRCHVV